MTCMFGHAHERLATQQFRVKCMERTVAVGATSGSVSALFLKLLSFALDTEPSLPFDCPVCPALDVPSEWLEKLDLPSLGVGLLLGLSLGPVLDLLHLVRESWRVWLKTRLVRLAQDRGSLYKVA